MLKTILFIPDTHRPYHDKRAWNLVLEVGDFLNPDIVVCLGDFADFFSVSSHSKDPKRAFKLDDEIADVRVGLNELKSLGADEKIFIAGNHEDRLSRYMMDRAPELDSFVSIPEILQLDKGGWTYIPYREDVKIGKIYLTHDVGSAGRGSVYKCMDAYQHSNITGHTHRMAYVVEADAAGQSKVAAQFGWLGDVEAADYMHRMKARKDWTLGFGIGYLDTKTGVVYITPVPIVDYTCVVNGKFFDGRKEKRRTRIVSKGKK